MPTTRPRVSPRGGGGAVESSGARTARFTPPAAAPAADVSEPLLEYDVVAVPCDDDGRVVLAAVQRVSLAYCQRCVANTL